MPLKLSIYFHDSRPTLAGLKQATPNASRIRTPYGPIGAAPMARRKVEGVPRGGE